MCGTNGAARQFADGVNVAIPSVTSGGSGKVWGVSINYAKNGVAYPPDLAQWAVAEILVWDSVLSESDMLQATAYLKYNVLGYVAPPPSPPPAPDSPPAAIPEGVPSDGLVAWFPSSRASLKWKSEKGNYIATVTRRQPCCED